MPETSGYEGPLQIYSTTVCRSGLPPFDAPPQDYPGYRNYTTIASPGQWVRFGHERAPMANSFHSDDQYTLEPPWAVTIHGMQLPSAGGDTVFADMTQALRCAFTGLIP